MSETQVDLSVCQYGDVAELRDGSRAVFLEHVCGRYEGQPRFKHAEGWVGVWNLNGRVNDVPSEHGLDIVRVTRDGKVITPAPAFPNAGPGQFREDLINAAEFVDNAGANELAGRLRAWAETEPAPAKPAEEVGGHVPDAGQMVDAPAAVISGPEWRPIETAPKGGTRFLVATKWGIVYIGRWWGLNFDIEGLSMGMEPCHLSHWMPLPEPPPIQPAAE